MITIRIRVVELNEPAKTCDSLVRIVVEACIFEDGITTHQASCEILGINNGDL